MINSLHSGSAQEKSFLLQPFIMGRRDHFGREGYKWFHLKIASDKRHIGWSWNKVKRFLIFGFLIICKDKHGKYGTTVMQNGTIWQSLKKNWAWLCLAATLKDLQESSINTGCVLNRTATIWIRDEGWKTEAAPESIQSGLNLPKSGKVKVIIYEIKRQETENHFS